MEAVHEQVEHVIRKYRALAASARRPAPTPAATFTFSSDLECRALHVFDTTMLIGPDPERIGRKMRDVWPADLFARIERCVKRAIKEKRARSFTYPHSGHTWKGTVIAVDPDTIIMNVVRACLTVAVVL